MIVRTAKTFIAAWRARDWPRIADPVPKGVFLVRPEAWRVNAETASDNPYMDLQSGADPERAAAQSRTLESALRAAGVRVKVFPGDPAATDGVFPNNVFATVAGRLVVGSMRHPGRRLEARRQDIRDWFEARGYQVADLSREDCVAELTGPLIIDRARRIGFCGMSERVDEAGLAAMHGAFELGLCFAFGLQAREYHTNVVMSILVGRACVLCPDSFTDPAVPDAIAQAFPGRALFLDAGEKNAFAANCIALTDRDLFISQAGADALRPSSRAALEDWGFTLHAVALDEIEKAGGSLRCMVAEIF